MHHVIGKVAGYLALPTWGIYLTGTAANLAMPLDQRPFRIGFLIMFAVLGLMFGMAWIVHVALLLSGEERQALYKQGVRDGIALSAGGPASDGLPLSSIITHQTQRLNGKAPSH